MEWESIRTVNRNKNCRATKLKCTEIKSCFIIINLMKNGMASTIRLDGGNNQRTLLGYKSSLVTSDDVDRQCTAAAAMWRHYHVIVIATCRTAPTLTRLTTGQSCVHCPDALIHAARWAGRSWNIYTNRRPCPGLCESRPEVRTCVTSHQGIADDTTHGSRVITLAAMAPCRSDGHLLATCYSRHSL